MKATVDDDDDTKKLQKEGKERKKKKKEKRKKKNWITRKTDDTYSQTLTSAAIAGTTASAQSARETLNSIL